MIVRWQQRIADEKASSVTWRSLPGEPIGKPGNLVVVFFFAAGQAEQWRCRASRRFRYRQSEQNCWRLSRNPALCGSSTNVASRSTTARALAALAIPRQGLGRRLGFGPRLERRLGRRLRRKNIALHILFPGIHGRLRQLRRSPVSDCATGSCGTTFPMMDNAARR